MLPVLADCLRASARRVFFVVGKGGVGKSTTAAALALYFADAGLSTHLVSTDPAHSVGDIFAVDLSGGPAVCPCTPVLTLEELDARRLARAWIDRASPFVAELVERGTYLDAEDARSLAALSLPGMDEIVGALRLLDLVDGDAARIVVDTAPTGHTLRLLDAGELIEGWAAALDAMADKAREVGSALVGAPVAAPGEQVVAELREQVARLRQEVLGRAGFVVVTRAGEVVAAETSRLLEELRRRGLALEAVLVVGGGEPRPVRRPETQAGVLLVDLPLSSELRGCSGLRAWGQPPGAPEPAASRALPASGAPSRAGARAGAAAALLDLPRELFLFAGKGGVGKTTCAAAFALGLGHTRDVVLLSTDPAGSLADVLGIDVPGGGARLGRMLAQQVDAAAELERIRGDYRREAAEAFEALGLDRAAALDRAVVEALWGLAPPGVDELLALARIIRSLESGAVLVLDPAPTGHFLRLLEMPRVALDWTHALMRLILKYRLAHSLDALARDLLQSARDLKDLLARLADPRRTAAFVVTLGEPVVAAESARLASALRSAHVPIAGTILNRADVGPTNGGGGGVSSDLLPGAADLTPAYLAPLLPLPPIGPEALGDFLGRWEIAR